MKKKFIFVLLTTLILGALVLIPLKLSAMADPCKSFSDECKKWTHPEDKVGMDACEKGAEACRKKLREIS